MQFLAHAKAIEYIAAISPSPVTIQRTEISTRFLEYLFDKLPPKDSDTLERLWKIRGLNIYADRVCLAGGSEQALGWVLRFVAMPGTVDNPVILALQNPEAKDRHLRGETKEVGQWAYLANQKDALMRLCFRRTQLRSHRVTDFDYEKAGIPDYALDSIRSSLSKPDLTVFCYTVGTDESSEMLGYLLRAKQGPEDGESIVLRTKLNLSKGAKVKTSAAARQGIGELYVGPEVLGTVGKFPEYQRKHLQLIAKHSKFLDQNDIDMAMKQDDPAAFLQLLVMDRILDLV